MVHTVTISDQLFEKLKSFLDQGLSHREALDKLLEVGITGPTSSPGLREALGASTSPLGQLTLDDSIKLARLEEIKERTKLLHVKRLAFESRMPRSAQIRNEVEKDTAEPDQTFRYCKTCDLVIFDPETIKVHVELKHDVKDYAPSSRTIASPSHVTHQSNPQGTISLSPRRE